MQEVEGGAGLDSLVRRCSRPRTRLVRTARVRLRELALLHTENPHWRLAAVLLMQVL